MSYATVFALMNTIIQSIIVAYNCNIKMNKMWDGKFMTQPYENNINVLGTYEHS